MWEGVQGWLGWMLAFRGYELGSGRRGLSAEPGFHSQTAGQHAAPSGLGFRTQAGRAPSLLCSSQDQLQGPCTGQWDGDGC